MDNFFRPLIKLTDRLLLVGVIIDEDIEKLLLMIDPETWDSTYDPEGKDEHKKGLLTMKMAGQSTYYVVLNRYNLFCFRGCQATNVLLASSPV
jgi:hypothetical protein